MQFGDYEATWVSGGQFRADGGAMFGVVPRPLWQKKMPPDEMNRILLETNCLLLRGNGQTILLDTGYGNKASAGTREHYALEPGHPLLANLEKLNVAPSEITLVVLSHLHFDHVGGATVRDSTGHVAAAFPRAKCIVQKAEWEDAVSEKPELVGSYHRQDLEALMDAGLVELIEGDVEIARGLCARVTGGHTRGHQILYIGSDDATLVFLSDFCPTLAHLRTFWLPAYDIYPIEMRRLKPQIFGEAAEHRWPVVFAHDAQSRAACIRTDAKHEFVMEHALKL